MDIQRSCSKAHDDRTRLVSSSNRCVKTTESMTDYFVGVDVGTGSVRAGLFTASGKSINISLEEIQTWNPKSNYYEQSSENIWNACVGCIKKVIQGVDKNRIRGIGFDATCSLVALDKSGKPLSVSPTGSNEQNIILWMDHRAEKEADEINHLNHEVLKYVGGKISLEMETPKLMWLKRNLREQCWNNAGYFFDLPDFLTWMATRCDSRSLCSLVCKWTYEIKADRKHGWNSEYFTEIGLDDIVSSNYKLIGTEVNNPGTKIANGLSNEVACLLGLLPGTAVGTSIIDAHAGGLGMIGCNVDGISSDFNSRLGLICGTSTCHMVVSQNPTFVPGVWGPYFSAMVPGMWLNEGGQSATGKLIDHIINTHPATEGIKTQIGQTHIQTYLSDLLVKMAKRDSLEFIGLLTKDIHVWPDFHGNRSPIADSTLKGMTCGLTLTTDDENLAVLYLATLQALAYGTKHIMDSLQQSGYTNLKSILICGGLSKNMLFIQNQADVVNMPVVIPDEKESVLLGSAILGAAASGYFKDVETAITSMGGSGSVVFPDAGVVEYHKKKYEVFLKMLEFQHTYRIIMQ